MGLLELYNQITNGILPTGDDKKHIDNMPLGNPQWENKNDNVTDYGNTTQITGKITPGQYPAGPIENFTQKYDQNNTYLDQVYTNPNNNQPSPNQDSLDASRLDNQNNPNPDPTVYPNNVNGQLFTQDDWEGSEYDTKVNRNNIVDSPLTDRLGDSDEYAPDEIAGPFNFTPEYNSDKEYDDNIDRDSKENSPLFEAAQYDPNLDRIPNSTTVIYNGPGDTTPDEIEGTFNFTTKYVDGDGLDYDDNVDRNSINNSPLANSLEESNLDNKTNPVYNGPGATTPNDIEGTFNFTPEYNPDKEYDDDVKLNNDQPELSPLYSKYKPEGTPTTFVDPTNYRGLSKKRSPVNGINPLEGSGSGKFNQEYNANKTYLDIISNNITIR